MVGSNDYGSEAEVGRCSHVIVAAVSRLCPMEMDSAQIKREWVMVVFR